MDTQAIRLLIRRKIWEGHLPPDRLSRVSWVSSNGETCDACSMMVTRVQVLIQGTNRAGDLPIQFHVRCFGIWNDERHTTRVRTTYRGHPSSPARLSASHAVPVALVGECSMPVV